MKKAKMFALASALFLIVGLFSACGSESNKPTEPSQAVTTKESESTKEATKEEKPQGGEKTGLPGTYNVPITKIFVDVPDYHAIECGLTKAFLDGDVKFFGVTCDQYDTANNAQEAYEKSLPGYLIDVYNNRMVNELGEHKSETLEINGMEVYKVEGKMSYGSNPMFDAYFVAYCFAMENKPCMVSGIVTDENQPEDQIRQVAEITEQMMRSVRDHK